MIILTTKNMVLAKTEIIGAISLFNKSIHNNIISLYIAKVDFSRKESVENEESDDKNGDACLISAGTDGKIKFWKIIN